MKKLLLSFAMLAALPFAKAGEPIDISETYLKNNKAPFEVTGETLIGDNTRWQKLAAPWVTAGDLTDESTGNITAWHVDFQKYPNYPAPGDANSKGVIAITPGWDGFAGTFSNMKLYQSFTLPAGQYELTGLRAQDWTGATGAYLVAAKGKGLPNIEDLSTGALGSAQFSTATEAGLWTLSVNFKLTEETEISIGAVASYTSVKQCVTLAELKLYKFEGANFKVLNALIASSKKYSSNEYPIGTTSGTFPQAKWDALQAAIVAAETFVATHANDATQEQVDAQLETLQNAVNDLNGSLVLSFKVSTEEKEYWYQVRDKRATNSYWKLGELIVGDEETDIYPIALVMSQESNEGSDDQLFKFVKAPAPSKGYYIYSKIVEDRPLSALASRNIIAINDTLPMTAWQFGKTSSGVHFNVFIEGDKSKQLNSYASYDPQRIGFYSVSEDLGNMWQFVQVVGEGETNFLALEELVAKAVVMNAAGYPVGNAENQYSQEKWDAFTATRTAALDLLNKTTATQEEVDAMVTLLQTAIDELKASQNPTYFASTSEKEYWYLVRDRRATPSYWKMGIQDVTVETPHQQLSMVKNKPTEVTDSVMFKLVKAEGKSGYSIYGKANKNQAITADQGGNFIGIDEFLDPTTWILTKTTTYPIYSLIQIEDENGEAIPAAQINSYATSATIKFWEGGQGDPGNCWTFEPAVETSVKEVKANELRIFVVNRTILSENPTDRLVVYNINGQQVNAKKQLSQGVYIVRIEGKAGAAKVVVR